MVQRTIFKYFLYYSASAASSALPSSSSLCNSLYTIAASAPPARGATMKIQTCDNAVASPSKNKLPNAVAIDLAGLTDVPVRPIPTKCTNVKVKPMIIPANFGADAFSDVALKITYTKINVNTTSANNAPIMPPALI